MFNDNPEERFLIVGSLKVRTDTQDDKFVGNDKSSLKNGPKGPCASVPTKIVWFTFNPTDLSNPSALGQL